MLIFISYSSRDQGLVERFCIEASMLGHNVSFEEKYRGSLFQWRQVFDNIADADLFVFIVTPNAVNSYSRRVEYEHATALGKPILAVQFAATDLSQLPEGMPEVVVYHPGNPALLAKQLNRQHASTPMVHSTPFAHLGRFVSSLREQISASQLASGEVPALVLNLQELLERRETFRAAVVLYSQLASRIEPTDPLAEQIQTTNAELQKNAGRRLLSVRTLRYILLIVLAVGVISIAFFVARFINVGSNNVPPVITPSATAPTARFVDVNVDSTSEVIAITTSTTTLSPEISPWVLTIPFTSPTVISSTITTIAPSDPLQQSTISAAVVTGPTATSLFTQPPSSTPALVPLSATPLPPSPTVTSSPIPLPPSPTITYPHTPLLPSSIPTDTATRSLLPSLTSTNTITPTGAEAVDRENLIPQRVYIGLTMENSSHGIQVTSIGRAAADAGIRPGDYILAVDYDSVNTVAEFSAAMNNRNAFSFAWLSLRRDNRIMLVVLKLDNEDFIVATLNTNHIS